MESYAVPLAAITFGAAIVNGALGYGFSSLTVPLALLFLSNRVLNPALVPIEVALNAYVLWVNREAIGAVWRRALPIVVGLLPVIGLPLPLVSSGGSALVTTLFALGIVVGFARRVPGAPEALAARGNVVKRSLAVVPLRVRREPRPTARSRS